MQHTFCISSNCCSAFCASSLSGATVAASNCATFSAFIFLLSRTNLQNKKNEMISANFEGRGSLDLNFSRITSFRSDFYKIFLEVADQNFNLRIDGERPRDIQTFIFVLTLNFQLHRRDPVRRGQGNGGRLKVIVI